MAPFMIRTFFVLLVLFVFPLSARAEDKVVAIQFLGGAKKVALEGLKITIRKDTGNFTADRQTSFANGKTGKDGTARFTLAEGSYYLDLASDKELPYLNIPMGYEGSDCRRYNWMIEVGRETSFRFNLADPCKLVIRAVDAGTGKGISGVCFRMESPTGESGYEVTGDNLGVDCKKPGAGVTDKDGDLVCYMGPWGEYRYFAWPVPEGYERVGDAEVVIPTDLGTAKAEHVFKFRKVRH